ncbi:MAG: hypothetical protein DRP56_07520 [Planctomycetota bacterium]|nr:MAG: hypothetical protein DRP56_07520 [Planctomycetota bacterium]RKY10946.1 MAG: hypothetical protein DRP52_06615 [Planctomycetota bacterium]
MKNRSKSDLPAKLARGRERFEKWRSKQKTRTRLPETLWSAAVKLAQEYGINRTARALRLDYSGLKRRAEVTVSDVSPQAGAEFIQLLSSELTTVAECAIECRHTDGSTIRIHLKGPELPDLAALSQSLWKGGQ